MFNGSQKQPWEQPPLSTNHSLLFGNSTPNPNPAQPTFGQPATQPTFGQPSTQPTFGQPSNQFNFGKSSTQNTFGKPTDQTTYGQPATQPTFGQPATQLTFGKPTAQPTFGLAITTPTTAKLNGQPPLDSQTWMDLILSMKTQLDKLVPASEPILHDGISCDHCRKKPLLGVRYKCIVCPDFDLCDLCEAMGIHSDHIFVKIKDTLKFNTLANQHGPKG
jgi:hypothetical protein